VVIVARGGGSLEDLWAFNDERVVRTVAAAPVPVVSGVGHESDVTLTDFAADVRAPTPSAAAELAVPDGTQLPAILARLRDRAGAAVGVRLADRRRLLAAESRALSAGAPNLAAARQQAGDLVDRGYRALVGRLGRERSSVDGLRAALRALGPQATLDRGYAIARLADGTIVRDPAQAALHAALEVIVARGRLATRVESGSPEADPIDGGQP
jgi:exodeoxyribonuclease VII large subunit